MYMETMNIPVASLLWRPLIPPGHVLLLTAVAAALAVVAYFRSMRGRPKLGLSLLAMRLAVLAALVTLLMGPSVSQTAPGKPRRPALRIMLDVSQSMLKPDAGDETRISFARRRWLSDELLQELASVCDVELAGFAEGISSLSVESLDKPAEELADGRETALAESVKKAVNQMNPAERDWAILVLSDGRDSNETPTAPIGQLARARGIPIHTVCLGGDYVQKDLVITARPAQRYLLAETEGGIRVRLLHEGLSREIAQREQLVRPLQVHAECDGETLSVPVVFDGEDAATALIPIRHDEPGTMTYRVWVGPMVDEVELSNNTQQVFVEVVRQRMRVLVLEAEPFWDTKFLAASLRKDPRIELVQVTRVSADKHTVIFTRTEKTDSPVGNDARSLADQYELIVIGRGLELLTETPLPAQLAEYVADYGGNVVFARGRSYDTGTADGRQVARDIAVIEPVVWSGHVLHNRALAAAPAGLGSFLSEDSFQPRHTSHLPTLDVLSGVDHIKTGATVLARALSPARAGSGSHDDAPPAIVSMHYGRGNVVAVLGEGLWRWSLLPPRSQADDGPSAYDEFWSRMVGWLVMGGDFKPSENVSLLLGADSVRLGTEVHIAAACRAVPENGFDPVVRVLEPNGTERRLAMRQSGSGSMRLWTQLTVRRPGVHTVTMDCPGATPERIEKHFNAFDVNMEILKAGAVPDAMADLSRYSGGRTPAPGQAEDFPQMLGELFAARQPATSIRYVWDRWVFLVLLLVWAGMEWIFRKTAGLL